MKLVKVFLWLLLPIAAMAQTLDEQVAASRQIAQRFGGQLKTELQTAMAAGGPQQAISVCNIQAPAIAQQLSGETDAKVGRTSLKVRNPSNAPDEWERAVLQRFEQQKAQGANVQTLEFYERVEVNGKMQFRYMKAIPTGQLCTTCHGTNIAQPIANQLTELYPQDEARGFNIGDIRGAFSITH